MLRTIKVSGLNPDVVASCEQITGTVSTADGTVIARKVFSPAGARSSGLEVAVDIPDGVDSVTLSITAPGVTPVSTTLAVPAPPPPPQSILSGDALVATVA